MDTKALANRVAAQHGTRDPFRIAEELGFIVIRAPLVEMRGLRQYVKRRTIVYVNACLDEPQQRLVCAHELGHHFLHRGLNRLFMDRNTCMVANKYENEAHRFAVDLLYDDADLRECAEWSDEQVARWMGVPLPLARYRRSTVPPLPGYKNPF